MERTNEQWKSREVARLLALVETERRYYQEMVANLPISVAVINEQGNLVAANRAFRQAYNIRVDELRKRGVQHLFPSNELQARIQSVFESGVGSRPLVIERTVPERPTPQKLRISVQAIRDWDEDSGIQALFVVEDVTDPGASETLLSFAPAAAFPDPLPGVVWMADAADRRFTFVSPSSRTLLDIDPEDWIRTGDSFAARIHIADREGVLAFYDRALANPGLYSSEFRMKRPGVWYRETILVEKDSLTGFITDITARRVLEEQAIQSQRFEAVAHIAGRLAHDVNNPLMIVNGYAEDLATAFPANDPRASDLREIQLAGKRIGELTNHLHSVTRKQLVNLVPVDVNAQLTRVVARMRVAAGEYLQADHAPSPEPLAVLADPGQLEAILLELAAALVEGGGETAHLLVSAKPYQAVERVRADQPLGAGEFVQISVLNQSHAGPHLNPRLFESLLPGKERGGEAGPALAKAYKTISDWGGAVRAIPENNEIWVYLKAAVPGSPAGPVIAPQPVKAAATVSPDPVRKSSILIVEDEPGIRALMRKILQREGFEVLEAANGGEALEILKEQGPFNLLITDVLMPGMSGLELATQVKQADPRCGILYMSGFTADTNVETGQFPPGSHFLQKPFTLGSLLEKANEVLASAQSR